MIKSKCDVYNDKKIHSRNRISIERSKVTGRFKVKQKINRVNYEFIYNNKPIKLKVCVNSKKKILSSGGLENFLKNTKKNKLSIPMQKIKKSIIINKII